LDVFTLRHSVCSFFCFGSLAVDPVGGALNYVIALLLPPIIALSPVQFLFCAVLTLHCLRQPISAGITDFLAWLAWLARLTRSYRPPRSPSSTQPSPCIRDSEHTSPARVWFPVPLPPSLLFCLSPSLFGDTSWSWRCARRGRRQPQLASTTVFATAAERSSPRPRPPRRRRRRRSI
jgi:hypothetical protein